MVIVSVVMEGAGQVAVGVHWLTFSVGGHDLEDVQEAIDGDFGPVEKVGGFGNTHRCFHESGACVYFGSKLETQPPVVNAPGEVCEGWSEQLLRAADGLKARVTRLDVAADVDPPELARKRLMEMRRAWKRDRVKTSMSLTSHRIFQDEDPEGGVTCYFGGQTSALQLRAYDRRGPLRLEWQWRPAKEMGEHVPGMVLKRGAAPVWRMLADAAIWPMPWYQQLLHGDRVEWKRPEVGESEFLKTVDQLRLQWGPTLWALQLLGLTLDDLAVRPEYPRPDVVAKILRYAQQASVEGYDPSKLREEVKRWRRSK